MTIDVVTIFPEMFAGPFDASILRRAQDKSLVEIHVRNLRDWAIDKHGTVDDRPYGGGPGMILRVDVIASALQSLKSKVKSPHFAIASRGRQKSKVMLLTPQGQMFDQEKARLLSQLDHLVLIAGHYEGVDERVREHLVDGDISIGDYVLTGGELPAMVVVDAVVRLIPGAVGDSASLAEESFSMVDEAGSMLLDYPQYTRPENFKGWSVPKLLLSGNHAEIARWRKAQSKKRTLNRRPEFLKKR